MSVSYKSLLGLVECVLTNDCLVCLAVCAWPALLICPYKTLLDLVGWTAGCCGSLGCSLCPQGVVHGPCKRHWHARIQGLQSFTVVRWLLKSVKCPTRMRDVSFVWALAIAGNNVAVQNMLYTAFCV